MNDPKLIKTAINFAALKSVAGLKKFYNANKAVSHAALGAAGGAAIGGATAGKDQGMKGALSGALLGGGLGAGAHYGLKALSGAKAPTAAVTAGKAHRGGSAVRASRQARKIPAQAAQPVAPIQRLALPAPGMSSAAGSGQTIIQGPSASIPRAGQSSLIRPQQRVVQQAAPVTPPVAPASVAGPAAQPVVSTPMSAPVAPAGPPPLTPAMRASGPQNPGLPTNSAFRRQPPPIPSTVVPANVRYGYRL